MVVLVLMGEAEKIKKQRQFRSIRFMIDGYTEEGNTCMKEKIQSLKSIFLLIFTSHRTLFFALLWLLVPYFLLLGVQENHNGNLRSYTPSLYLDRRLPRWQQQQSLNKRFNEQCNGYAHALQSLTHFFSVLCNFCIVWGTWHTTPTCNFFKIFFKFIAEFKI